MVVINKCGVGVQLVFQLAQHLRDELLLESFVTYFNCGRLVRVVENHWGYFQSTKFSDNYDIIIEFDRFAQKTSYTVAAQKKVKISLIELE